MAVSKALAKAHTGRTRETILLLHNGVIHPVKDSGGPHVIVQIGVSDSDVVITTPSPQK